jgi:hypothetical protein
LLSEPRDNQPGHEGNHQCDHAHNSSLLIWREIFALLLDFHKTDARR